MIVGLDPEIVLVAGLFRVSEEFVLETTEEFTDETAKAGLTTIVIFEKAVLFLASLITYGKPVVPV